MLDKLVNVIQEELKKVKDEGRSKGRETVIQGVKPATGEKGPRVMIDGCEVINMASNGYLGLHMHPKVIEAERKATERFGVGPAAVRFISGTQSPHIELERRLADFHGKEAGMIYSSAYSANGGVIPALLNDKSMVISDELNHNSIITAIRLSKAKKNIFPHSDMEGLEKCLQDARGEVDRVMVVTDGVFSMRGDRADLKGIVKLSQKYNDDFSDGVFAVVDDSHGTGAVGDTGRGTMEYVGEDDVDLITSTLGKALGVNGGYIVGNAVVIDYLREISPFYVYSNPITAGEAQAAVEALNIIDGPEGKELLARLKRNVSFFRDGISKAGFESIPGPHPIVPVLVRDAKKAKRMVQELFKKGVLTKEITYPVVPRGEDTIRVQVSASHTEHDLQFALDAFAALG